MVSLMIILLMVLVAIPILLGVGAWAAYWFKTEFYAEPLYTEAEYNQQA
jgi:hypothetical protein